MSFTEQQSVASHVSPKQDQISRELERLNQLRQQVILQEQKVQKLNLSDDGDTDAFIKSLIQMKEREIALALMRVAELTRQLEQLKQGSVDRRILTDSTLVNSQLLEKQPDLVRGIISPLSSAAPHSTPLVPSTSSPLGSSILDRLAPINSTDCSCPPPEVAQVPYSASQHVDCNENLVTQKLADRIVNRLDGGSASGRTSFKTVIKWSPSRSVIPRKDAQPRDESVAKRLQFGVEVVDTNGHCSASNNGMLPSLNEFDSKTHGTAESKHVKSPELGTVDFEAAPKVNVEAGRDRHVGGICDDEMTTKLTKSSDTDHHQLSPIQDIDASDLDSDGSMVEHIDACEGVSCQPQTGSSVNAFENYSPVYVTDAAQRLHPEIVTETAQRFHPEIVTDAARSCHPEIVTDAARSCHPEIVAKRNPVILPSFIHHKETVASDTESDCSMIEHSDVANESYAAAQTDWLSSVVENEKTFSVSADDVDHFQKEIAAESSLLKVDSSLPPTESDTDSDCSMVVEHNDVADEFSTEAQNFPVSADSSAQVLQNKVAAENSNLLKVKSSLSREETDTDSDCSVVEQSEMPNEHSTDVRLNPAAFVTKIEKNSAISSDDIQVFGHENIKDAPNSVSRAGEQFQSVAAGDIDSAMLVLRGKGLINRPGSASSPSVARYQQRLSASTASRFSSISDRLYGGWFDASANRASRLSSGTVRTVTSMSPVSNSFDSVSVAAKMPTDGEPGLPVDSVSHSTASNNPISASVDAELTTDGTDDGETGRPVGNTSVEHSAVDDKDSNIDDETECTSDETFDSSDEDVGDFRDSAEDMFRGAVGGLLDPYGFQHNDSFTNKELKHWHHRLYTSPPPKRLPFLRPESKVHAKEVDIDDIDEEFVDASRVSRKRSKSVTFDPFTLSLNAALEGELETLKRTFLEVDDPNRANDDGLTVLHNAVCSGNLELIEFLIDSGCNVNVADHDGWTPLHCAASSNNVLAVKMLVEHGSSLMALSWHPDYETPLQKCVPDTPGFNDCVKYMTEMLELVGTANDSKVYATCKYAALNDDELSFEAGAQLIIVRQGDKDEPLWWWARNEDGVEGYVPPNLIAFYKQTATRSLIQTSC